MVTGWNTEGALQVIYGGIKNLKNKCDHLLNFISVAACSLSNAESAGGHVPKKAFFKGPFGVLGGKKGLLGP